MSYLVVLFAACLSQTTPSAELNLNECRVAITTALTCTEFLQGSGLRILKKDRKTIEVSALRDDVFEVKGVLTVSMNGFNYRTTKTLTSMTPFTPSSDRTVNSAVFVATTFQKRWKGPGILIIFRGREGDVDSFRVSRWPLVMSQSSWVAVKHSNKIVSEEPIH